MPRMLPVGLLLTTLIPASVWAGEVVEGESLRTIYTDTTGLWWGTGADSSGTSVTGGIQMFYGGAWQDFMIATQLWVFWGFEWEQPAGSPFTSYGGYSGTGPYSDWTVLASSQMGTDEFAMYYVEMQDPAGSLHVQKTESWDIAGQTIYVQMVLTNESATTDIENVRYMAAFDPYDAYNRNPSTLNDTQDLTGDGVSDWVQSAGYASGATKRYTVGFGLCDPDHQVLGHGSYDEDCDAILFDGAGGRTNNTMHVGGSVELIAADDAVVVSFLVATGSSDAVARVNVAAAFDECTTCDTDADGVENVLCMGTDCDDHDAEIYPGAPDDWYDGTDADCGDDDDFDADGDGHVPDEYAGRATDGLAGTGALPADDCLDTDAAVYLGAPETWYDGLDADCGGEDDYDQDGDGYVPTEYYGDTTVNVAGSGRLPGDDCDDEDPLINNGAAEVWYDGVDQDCYDDDDYDQDHDGYAASGYGGVSGLPDGDCNDLNSGISPGIIEAWYDGSDSNCDGADDYDQDGDGQVEAAYAGQVTAGVAGSGLLPATDCDDEDGDRFVGATDVWYDGADSDCGFEDDYDADGDGYVYDAYGGLITEGVAGTGLLLDGDCDDANADANPGEVEVWYDGVDQDCDGIDGDQDGDGYDWLIDCNDTDGAVNPGASDDPYDGVDANCSGNNDYDADGDGYAPDAYASIAGIPGGDCDDTNGDANPTATEIGYDGVDADCDGADDYDADGDGHAALGYDTESSLPADDCDDNDAAVNPDEEESWYDGTDSDCDSESDWDQDRDGHDEGGYDQDGDGVVDVDPDGDDCNDEEGSISPSAVETCYDGVDSNCVPADEYDCDGDSYEQTYDRNGDGTIDAADEEPGDDCDDGDASIHPDASEVCYDGTDSDCIDTNEYDCDDDGHDAPGYDKDGDGNPDVDPDGDDCNDDDEDVSPSADDICYDGVDSNCDFLSDYDCDGDDHLSDVYGGDDCDDADPDKWETCAVDGDGDGYLPCEDPNDTECDCDDDDDQIHPGASEICGDTIDQNCDPTDECDCDGDGVESADCAGSDYCDDDPSSVCDPNEKDLGFFKGGGGCSGEGCGAGADTGVATVLLLGIGALTRRRRRA